MPDAGGSGFSIACPGPVTLQCFAPPAPATTLAEFLAQGGSVSGNCPGEVTISHVDSDNGASGCAGQPLIITRTYTAMDACENVSAPCSQTISFEDNTAPTLTVPPDVTVGCTDCTDPTQNCTGMATASDACEASPTITYSDQILPNTACPLGRIIRRTWKATDECGNVSTPRVQTIRVTDTTKPQIVCPGDIVVPCNGCFHFECIGFATASDNCDPAPIITFSDDVGFNVITRTWRARDLCGNVSDPCTQVIRAEECGCPSGGVELGGLRDYLFVFTDGRVDANWQSSSKGYVGDVAINGLLARERTSGDFAYAGTIYTNDSTLGAWEKIVNNNPGQAFRSYNQGPLLAQLEADLLSAMAQINAMPVTPGFASVSSMSLDNLNKQNGISETIVINVTSGLKVSKQINIFGDAGDVFILRWDEDANFANGYQGQVKFQSGGAIVPRGGLTPASFYHVAGDLNASGGGSNPPPPYPQGPRLNNGQGALIQGGKNWSGGGFFTGYWLTTGKPENRETSPFSTAIFVGGWYSTTTKFSMTSNTSGVHVECPGDGGGD